MNLKSLLLEGLLRDDELQKEIVEQSHKKHKAKSNASTESGERV